MNKYNCGKKNIAQILYNQYFTNSFTYDVVVCIYNMCDGIFYNILFKYILRARKSSSNIIVISKNYKIKTIHELQYYNLFYTHKILIYSKY